MLDSQEGWKFYFQVFANIEFYIRWKELDNRFSSANGYETHEIILNL